MQRYVLAVGVLSLLFLSACGSSDRPPLARVSGTVTLDDKPLEGARVTFTPAEGRPSTGTTDSEGKYELQYAVDAMGASVGEHTVTVEPPELDDDLSEEEAARKGMTLPAAASDGSLKKEVTSGSNDIPIAL